LWIRLSPPNVNLVYSSDIGSLWKHVWWNDSTEIILLEWISISKLIFLSLASLLWFYFLRKYHNKLREKLCMYKSLWFLEDM